MGLRTRVLLPNLSILKWNVALGTFSNSGRFRRFRVRWRWGSPCGALVGVGEMCLSCQFLAFRGVSCVWFGVVVHFSLRFARAASQIPGTSRVCENALFGLRRYPSTNTPRARRNSSRSERIKGCISQPGCRVSARRAGARISVGSEASFDPSTPVGEVCSIKANSVGKSWPSRHQIDS